MVGGAVRVMGQVTALTFGILVRGLQSAVGPAQEMGRVEHGVLFE